MSDSIKDFRGVACPMNFVKTKLALDKIQAGETLQVLLDDGEPKESVCSSIAAEGHEIVDLQKKSEGHWSLSIRKV